MPDFGLSAALEAALKGGREANVMRAGEAELATRAGLRSAAPEAGAQGIKTPLPDIQAPGVPDVSIPKVNITLPGGTRAACRAPAATPPGDVATSPAAGQPCRSG